MTAPATSAPAPKGRLGNGQLRRQVAEWLAARPGPHTVGEMAWPDDVRESEMPSSAGVGLLCPRYRRSAAR
jgi:hypothetical protein